MMPEVKIYTYEQSTRLEQFKRAERLWKNVSSHEQEIMDGNVYLARDWLNEMKVFQIGEFRMLRGALAGMFTECMDLGLKEEIK